MTPKEIVERLRAAAETKVTADDPAEQHIADMVADVATRPFIEAADLIEKWDKWFTDNAANLATHRIGGFRFH